MMSISETALAGFGMDTGAEVGAPGAGPERLCNGMVGCNNTVEGLTEADEGSEQDTHCREVEGRCSKPVGCGEQAASRSCASFGFRRAFWVIEWR